MSSGHSSPLPGLGAIEGFLHKTWDQGGTVISVRVLIIAFAVAVFAFFIASPTQSFQNFELLIFIAPLWVPVLLLRFESVLWGQARRRAYNAKQDYVLLEIRMPRDTRKSPLAMEGIFANLHLKPGESNWFKLYWNGSVRPWWSLEIVSLGGRIHFYIWTREVYRRLIESSFYAQYPGVEIVEAVDYSLLIEPGHGEWKGFACEYKHGKEDPYPIKTYVDFGLDKQPMPKPEEQSDPLAQVLETMGSIGPNEQLWVQMIIRVNSGEKYAGKRNAKGKPYSWKDEAKELIESIRAGAVRKVKKVDKATGIPYEEDGFPNPTKGEQEVINAIERNIAKPAFDVGMRGIYAAKEGSFHGVMPGALGFIFKPFNSETLNSINWTRWHVAFNDYPWEDPHGHHHAHVMHQALDFYRRRSFFHAPYIGDWMVMSTEELATVFHVPGAGITTPSLPRIQSSTASAPPNLPT
ncbi:MAG: hypothetical protein AAB737_04415 [Patescibacteria group bacterium]